MASQDKRGEARDGGARILSASIIGLSALAIVGGFAFTQMRGDNASLTSLQDHPTPPRNLAQTEAARTAAEKRLSDAMALQIMQQPPVPAQATPDKPPLERKASLDPAPFTTPMTAPMTTSPTASTMPLAEQDAMLTRVAGLLAQGDIGAARAILNRLVRENNAKAAYLLAQSYDPQAQRQGRVVGLRGDVALARALYEQALRGGVQEAKTALDALPGNQ